MRYVKISDYEALSQYVGEQIKHEREKQGLTRAALCKLTGLHKNTLYLIEGPAQPNSSVATILAIIDALDLTCDEFFARCWERMKKDKEQCGGRGYAN